MFLSLSYRSWVFLFLLCWLFRPLLAQNSPCECGDEMDCGLQVFADEISAFTDFDSDMQELAFNECVPLGFMDVRNYDLFVDQSQSHQFCGTFTAGPTTTQIGIRQLVILRRRCSIASIQYQLFSECSESPVTYVGQDVNGGSRGFQYYYISPGTTYRICRTLTVNNSDPDCDWGYNCTGDPEFTAASLFVYPSGVILPMQWLEVHATAEELGVQISWTAAEQSGLKAYVIERRKNDHQYEEVGMMMPLIQRSNTKSYTYLDTDASYISPDSLLYRIRATDSNGNASYSPLLKVGNTLNPALSLEVFPNPVVQEVHLEFQHLDKEGASLQVLGPNGQEVHRKHLQAMQGLYAIDAENWASGAYSALIFTENGQKTVRFWIQ